MDPDFFRHIKKMFENRGMQEWIKNVERPEMQAWMKDLQSSGMQAWLKDLPRSGMEGHMRNFQRPEMQAFLKYVQQPETQRWMKDLSGFQNVMKHDLPITGYRLPPAVFSPSFDIDSNMARAAAEAAKSAQATQLSGIIQDFAKSVNVDFPTEALASAQYSALRHAMETPAWMNTIRELARSPLTEIQASYAETMRDATRLLSDETIRRLMELAESAELIEEGLDTAEGMDSPLEDITAEEGLEYMGLGTGNAVDTLLPMLQWAILVFSIALVMTFSAPDLKEYKQPLAETVAKLTLLERALKMYKDRSEEKND